MALIPTLKNSDDGNPSIYSGISAELAISRLFCGKLLVWKVWLLIAAAVVFPAIA